jgi:hypothetical protein
MHALAFVKAMNKELTLFKESPIDDRQRRLYKIIVVLDEHAHDLKKMNRESLEVADSAREALKKIDAYNEYVNANGFNFSPETLQKMNAIIQRLKLTVEAFKNGFETYYKGVIMRSEILAAKQNDMIRKMAKTNAKLNFGRGMSKKEFVSSATAEMSESLKKEYENVVREENFCESAEENLKTQKKYADNLSVMVNDVLSMTQEYYDKEKKIKGTNSRADALKANINFIENDLLPKLDDIKDKIKNEKKELDEVINLY